MSHADTIRQIADLVRTGQLKAAALESWSLEHLTRAALAEAFAALFGYAPHRSFRKADLAAMMRNYLLAYARQLEAA